MVQNRSFRISISDLKKKEHEWLFFLLIEGLIWVLMVNGRKYTQNAHLSNNKRGNGKKGKSQ